MRVTSFLIDIDGTLYDGEWAYPGGPEALEAIKERGLPFLLVTNTTRFPKREILARLERLGYRVAPEEVFPVPLAAVNYIRARKPSARCFVIGAPTIDEELQAAGLTVVRQEELVDFVVLSQYSWIHMGEVGMAYRLILAGAEAVAMHRDMTYPEGGIIHVSLGAVVLALEALTRKPITIVGKPNPRFFDLALEYAGFDKAGTVMIGDNYEGDVRGAIQAGLRAIQIQTGGYEARAVRQGDVQPTWALPSIADMPRWLDSVVPL